MILLFFQVPIRHRKSYFIFILQKMTTLWDLWYVLVFLFEHTFIVWIVIKEYKNSHKIFNTEKHEAHARNGIQHDVWNIHLYRNVLILKISIFILFYHVFKNNKKTKAKN